MEPRKNSRTQSPKSGTAKRNSPAKPTGDKKASVSKSEKKDAGAHPFDKFMKKTNPKTAYKNERKQDRLTEEKNKKEFFASKDSNFKTDRPYAKKDAAISKYGPAPKISDYTKAKATPERTSKTGKKLISKKSFHHNQDFEEVPEAAMPLNKYLAHAGICGRRDAATLIKSGKVTLNGVVFTEPGYRVQETDVVMYDQVVVKPVQDKVYILLNKPKGFITTTDDERSRKTVMDLVKNADAGRMYPVGRLDRNTTGLLLMTNDGDLAQKLSHPKNAVKKIYQAELDKDFKKEDFEKVQAGLTLEDGLIKVDEIAYLESKRTIGIEIHSGKNRIVRRIFESLGYVVEKLDRVMYANLTKKNIQRGKWRFLTDKEIIFLKHFK